MRVTAIIIEVIGIATTGMGIGLEIAKGGTAYLVVITVGSLLVASGGLIFSKFIRGRNVISKD